MPKRNDPDPVEETTQKEDTKDPRTFEHDDAEEVRQGNLSAAQMSGGHGNVDPDNPDAQYPPGIVDNSGATLNPDADPASFLPERKSQAQPKAETTTLQPDYS